jgi:carboxypeptidase C (cathepsin A)
MNDGVNTPNGETDQPLLDITPYGFGQDDWIADATENAAVTQHTVTINRKTISYTARAGHLVTTDLYSSKPVAKIFYVAFTANGASLNRPLTFFYNGGPGSSCAFLLLGSFGPRRIRTKLPDYTPPAPYMVEENQESLLDRSDLVFINPVGTAYSTAIAPAKNGDFWGVDEDARSIKQFVKRYLTVFNRWNSPKFLFGESYGTPRTSVLAWLLHEDGVDLNGVILESSILDYSKYNNSVGLLPTLAADAYFHDKVTVSPPPSDLTAFLTDVVKFARGRFASAEATFPNYDPAVVRLLSKMVGIQPTALKSWKLDLGANRTAFLTGLFRKEGRAIGVFDGRVTGEDTGIAGSIGSGSPTSSIVNDPSISAIAGVFTAMWHEYLNNELKYTSIAPFMDVNDQAFLKWNFDHRDPTGAQTGGDQTLYTAGDLAAAIAVNPYLKVFSANGYYDAVTPYLQTLLNFENMPLDEKYRQEALTIRNYPSGHMIYLDNAARAAMKSDLALFFDTSRNQIRETRTSGRAYSRRMNRSPY